MESKTPAETDSPEKWGDAMDRRAHERAYAQFLTFTKRGIIAAVVALIVVAWALKG